MQGITNAITSSENLELYYTKGETDTLLAGKANVATTLAGYGITDGANTALSNLSASGQMIIDSANGTISNCILKIPQNIKLTLENNVLTLKSGSTVVDGRSVYTTVTTMEDKNYTISSALSGRYLVFVRVSDFAFNLVRNDKCVSGATDSLAELAENHIWLDTTAKEVNMVFSTGGKAIRSYPFCVIDVIDGVASFAKDSNGRDMIFNGAGFIGHHVFIYPNIKVLLPNGFNADGSLKSVEVTTNSLQIIEVGSASSTRIGAILLSGSVQGVGAGYYEYDILPSTPPYNNAEYYEKFTNKSFQYYNNLYHEYFATKLYNVSSVSSSGVISITDFTIRQPYEGARYLLTDDLYKQIGNIETLLATV